MGTQIEEFIEDFQNNVSFESASNLCEALLTICCLHLSPVCDGAHIDYLDQMKSRVLNNVVELEKELKK